MWPTASMSANRTGHDSLVASSAVNSGSDFPTTKFERTFRPPLDSAIKGIKPSGSGSGFNVCMFTCTHNAAVSMRAPSAPTMCVRRSAQCDP